MISDYPCCFFLLLFLKQKIKRFFLKSLIWRKGIKLKRRKKLHLFERVFELLTEYIRLHSFYQSKKQFQNKWINFLKSSINALLFNFYVTHFDDWVKNKLTVSLQGGKSLIHTNECPVYNTNLYLKLRLLSWIFGECGLSLHCHNSQIHSVLDWSYLLESTELFNHLQNVKTKQQLLRSLLLNLFSSFPIIASN